MQHMQMLKGFLNVYSAQQVLYSLIEICGVEISLVGISWMGICLVEIYLVKIFRMENWSFFSVNE